MATAKKPTAAPKVATKKADKKVNYSAMSAEGLTKALAEKQQDLLNSVRSLKGGELVNPRVLNANRKEIARIHTAIRATEAAHKESK